MTDPIFCLPAPNSVLRQWSPPRGKSHVEVDIIVLYGRPVFGPCICFTTNPLFCLPDKNSLLRHRRAPPSLSPSSSCAPEAAPAVAAAPPPVLLVPAGGPATRPGGFAFLRRGSSHGLNWWPCSVQERAAGTNTGCGQTRTVVVRNKCEHKEDFAARMTAGVTWYTPSHKECTGTYWYGAAIATRQTWVRMQPTKSSPRSIACIRARLLEGEVGEDLRRDGSERREKNSRGYSSPWEFEPNRSIMVCGNIRTRPQAVSCLVCNPDTVRME
ncbi:hypothetical protein B0H10DRAFT_1962658 [Mycena sp. CBHHK59/15]|nr:hypothetical protein B0H10DRAFT_1962658 [Mycena sp. CBHHK59/15]